MSAVCDGCADLTELKEAVTDQRLRCSDHEDTLSMALDTRNWSLVEQLRDEVQNARIRRAAEYPRPMGAM